MITYLEINADDDDELGGLTTCPMWWQNFIHSTQADLGDDRDSSHWEGDREEALSKWHCRSYWSGRDGGILRFETEKDAALFLLRWS